MEAQAGTPGGGKPKGPRGEVHVVWERCKGCGFCIEFCPKDVLAFSEEFNRKGYHPPKVERVDACTHCKLCGMLCPDFAIYSVARPDCDDPGRVVKTTGK